MGAYSDLINEIPKHIQMTGGRFNEALPTIIKLATLRMAREMPITGLHAEAGGNLVIGEPLVTVPGTILTTRYFLIVDPVRGQIVLKQRQSDWIRGFWPSVTALGTPKYYAAQQAKRVRVAPTPDAEYPWVLGYRRSPSLLSTENEDNEISDVYYNVLFYACMAEAAVYALDDRRAGMIQEYEGKYQQGKQTIIGNEVARVRDAANTKPPEGGF